MTIPIGGIARVRDDAPSRFRPGESGVVAGVRRADSDLFAAALGVPEGSRVVTLEFGDGVRREIPEAYLDDDAIA